MFSEPLVLKCLFRSTRRSWLCVLILFSWSVAFAGEWSGTQTDFHSFDQFDFEVDDLDCKIIVPKEAAKGRPWIWRARFFGHEPQTEIALLEKGFHVAYVDVADLFGSPKAIDRWDRFYEYLTESHGFSKKTVLEGLSRGGLIIYNWAAINPDKVHCIYADAPVCDFKSWPMKKSSKATWQKCLDAYEMTEAEALQFRGNPIDNLKPLAEAGIALLHVIGEADEVVPVADNTAVIEKRYKALGGSIEVIRKPGIGHHPHSLVDPKPIVDFVLKHMRRE